MKSVHSLTMSILALFLTVITFSARSNNCSLYPISLTEKVDSSSLIVSGQVISQNSYWNVDGTLIYTSNTILLHEIFKGNALGSTIEIRTIGGKVGNDQLFASSLLSLELGDKGLFFCNSITNSSQQYSVYSSSQGFLEYDLNLQKAKCPFYESSIGQLNATLNQKMNSNPIIIQPFVLAPPVPKILGSDIFLDPEIITAGTGSVLKVLGTGFGTSGPSITDFVAFPSADDGGAPNYAQPPLTNYLSWSDTLIELIVPNTAGTGPVLVEVGGTVHYSNMDLTVPYALTNSFGDTLSQLIDINSNGGLTWTMNISVFGGGAEPPFLRAVDSWRCATGINWDISPNATVIGGQGNDGVNVIYYGPTPAGVLGICYSFVGSCNSTDSYIAGQDIVFSSTASWYYDLGVPGASQADFESVALHELGHAHLLDHVVSYGDVMHYSIALGDYKRVLSPYNVAAGNYVMDRSTQVGGCSQPAHIQDFASSCSHPAITDVWNLGPKIVPDDSTCFGVMPLYVDFGNYGADTAVQIEWNWSVNGVLQTPATWNGSLATSGQVNNFLIGNYDFQDSLYEVIIWSNLVNGLTEYNQTNDTISFQFHPVSCTPDDASVISVTEFSDYECYSSEAIDITIQNTGENDLTSCWVYIESQGVLVDSVLWSGVLAPGDTSTSFYGTTLNSFDEFNSLKIWTSMPNGVIDTYTANDTLLYSFQLYRLDGVYTIGGAAPDFVNIQDALDRLNDYGMCGDVTLNIRDGVYTEALHLDSIPAPSDDLWLTIQSENQDYQLVELRNVNTVINESVLEIDSTRNVRIQHLSFYSQCQAQNTAIRGVIEMSNGTSNIYIDSNLIHFDTSYFNSTFIYLDAVWQNRSADNIFIQNNRFIDGKGGVYVDYSLSESSTANNLKIINNEINSTVREVIKIGKYGNVEIADNKLVHESDISSYELMGINIEVDTMNVHHNLIQKIGKGGAITIQGDNNADSVVMSMSNNAVSHIRTENTFQVSSVQIWHINYVDLLHNTFTMEYFDDFANTSRILYLASSDSASILNNHFRNTGKGYIYYNSNILSLNSDNNNYWTEGELGRWDGVTYPSLSNHIAGLNVDSNSTEIYPDFASFDYLVPMNMYELDDLGIGVPSISNDLLDISRDPITPDVGAYEYHQFEYDLSLDALEIADTVICTGDSVDLYISVTNYGSLPVDSFSVYVEIEGGILDTNVIYASLLPQQTGLFLVNNYTLNDIQLEIDVEIALPNNVIDSMAYNNMLSDTLSTRLSGVYTVGGPTADFNTIQLALSNLMEYGLCGPVIFNLKDGTHDNWGTLTKVPNNNSVNTITFQSETLDTAAVKISADDLDYRLTLDGLKYITFKHLTFAPHSVYTNPALLLDSVYHLTVDSCRFSEAFISHSTYAAFTDEISVSNSKFENTPLSFTSGNSVVSNVHLFDNLFEGNGEVLFISNSGTGPHPTNILIEKNTFNSDLWNLNSEASIIVEYGEDFEISGNDITSDGFCIEVKYCHAGNNVIKNNFLKTNFDAFTLTGNSSLKIYNNSLYSGGLRLYSNPSVEFKNNIIHQVWGDHFFYFNFTNNYGIPELQTDNNLFFGDEVEFAYETGIGFIPYSTWQGAYSKDLNSFTGDPVYYSATDLHTNSLIADSSGLVLPEVTHDFDGELRNLTNPDIGADEYVVDWSIIFDVSADSLISPLNNTCSVGDSIWIAFSNNIDDTLFNVSFDWSIDGGSTNTTLWADTLITGQGTNIFLGLGTFVEGGTYSIDVQIHSPNGMTDLDPSNNFISFIYTAYESVEILANQNFMCLGTSLELTSSLNSPGATFLWSDASVNSNVLIPTGGTWSLDYVDENGCQSNDTIYIIEHPEPVQVLITPADSAICLGDTITLYADPIIAGTNYYWNGSTVSYTSVTTTFLGQLSLEAVDINGCSTTDLTNIYYETIPTADFTVVGNVFTGPSGTNYLYQWYFNNQPIPGATNQVYTAMQEGNYYLVVQNIAGCEESSMVHYHVPVGLSENELVNVEIYPNPAFDHLWISGLEGDYTVNIFDAIGKLCSSVGMSGHNKLELNEFSEGVYFVEINSSGWKSRTKIVVQSK